MVHLEEARRATFPGPSFLIVSPIPRATISAASSQEISAHPSPFLLRGDLSLSWWQRISRAAFPLEQREPSLTGWPGM